jgi:hypothetical protein
MPFAHKLREQAVIRTRERDMLRIRWIYRLGLLAALLLASGAGTKWT